MKKTILVTIEKTVEIDIPDAMLTPEELKSFSRMMWDADKPEDLLRYAATQVANYGHDTFIEGLGQCRFPSPKAKEHGDLFAEILDEGVTTEIQ